MNNVTATASSRIISTILNHIDIENLTCNTISIPPNNAEMESYLTSLLDELRDSPSKREYNFQRNTTELYLALSSFYQNRDLLANPLANSLAKRLLSQEVDADKSYGHLGNKANGQVGHLKRGSFLQFVYEEGGETFFLGVKVDHQALIDETDFIKRFGLAINNKLYKACLVTFDAAGLPNNVFVYDTNTKPARYWWNSFLELSALRDDKHNTGEAINAVVKTLASIKRNFPNDYAILRNASIAAFKQQGEMKFDEFIQNTFASYTPVNEEFAGVKLTSLCDKLKALPQKKNFDNNFTLHPAAVKFTERNIKLTPDISVRIAEGINNQNEKVWREVTQSGRKLLVIDAPNAPDDFVEKERIL